MCDVSFSCNVSLPGQRRNAWDKCFLVAKRNALWFYENSSLKTPIRNLKITIIRQNVDIYCCLEVFHVEGGHTAIIFANEAEMSEFYYKVAPFCPTQAKQVRHYYSTNPNKERDAFESEAATQVANEMVKIIPLAAPYSVLSDGKLVNASTLPHQAQHVLIQPNPVDKAQKRRGSNPQRKCVYYAMSGAVDGPEDGPLRSPAKRPRVNSQLWAPETTVITASHEPRLAQTTTGDARLPLTAEMSEVPSVDAEHSSPRSVAVPALLQSTAALQIDTISKAASANNMRDGTELESASHQPPDAVSVDLDRVCNLIQQAIKKPVESRTTLKNELWQELREMPNAHELASFAAETCIALGNWLSRSNSGNERHEFIDTIMHMLAMLLDACELRKDVV